jgi:hypothetical protein
MNCYGDNVSNRVHDHNYWRFVWQIRDRIDKQARSRVGLIGAQINNGALTWIWSLIYNKVTGGNP